MSVSGLSGEWELIPGDSAEVLRTLPDAIFDSIVTDPPAGIGFMGKGWDSDKGGRDQWIAWLAGILGEALRVLKPGGHALVWAIPRTSHWTAMALELAGFEIRDVVTHLFATGFPKSLDISKAIDAHLGYERQVVGTNPNHRAVSGVEYEGVYAGGNTGAATITAPGSPEAAQWDGWGTALKPAAEHWILARKPLVGTYAENVLTYGVGGLNIDGCRIASTRPKDEGRWPANVTLDEEAAAVLDASVPPSTSRKGKPRAGKSGDGWGLTTTGAEYSDSGGPSRFFYVAKPSRAEKEAGLEHLPPRTAGEATDREDGSAGLNNPRAGAGRTGGARNFHPTVKSLTLMEWLIRLTTPVGGTVLDPFAGSGSTLCAAVRAGFNAIGIEQDPDYFELARSRVGYWAARFRGEPAPGATAGAPNASSEIHPQEQAA